MPGVLPFGMFKCRFQFTKHYFVFHIFCWLRQIFRVVRHGIPILFFYDVQKVQTKNWRRWLLYLRSWWSAYCLLYKCNGDMRDTSESPDVWPNNLRRRQRWDSWSKNLETFPLSDWHDLQRMGSGMYCRTNTVHQAMSILLGKLYRLKVSNRTPEGRKFPSIFFLL